MKAKEQTVSFFYLVQGIINRSIEGNSYLEHPSAGTKRIPRQPLTKYQDACTNEVVVL